VNRKDIDWESLSSDDIAEMKATKLADDEFHNRYMLALDSANRRRREGRGSDAIPLFEEALSALEMVSTNTAEGFLPPGAYIEYAKMLYHMGQDAKAVEVMDRLLTVIGESDSALVNLREDIRQGKMRRLRSKYR
jgi:hypothetical protein